MFHWRAEIRPGLSVAFTDADAGNLALHVGDDPDEVGRRRRDLERAIGVAPKGLRFMNQVHGNAVAVMDQDTAAPQADAMVSRGVPLAVMVADCIPVLLAGDAPEGPVVAAVHAGRPGIANGVIPAAVDSMKSLGAGGIRAWLGPSICGNCYEVPAGLQAEVTAAVPASLSTTTWGTPGLDLPAGARSQLEQAGVAVEYSGPCTLETPSLFSYRRNKFTGRFAGLVWCHD
ncbi:multi-copper polyphenol oxidoreductase laccase family protein [Pseudarthrobacter siccitolerans]|uniref:Multi-copper polyphenol oxidoreductase laccase family protein n=1 Tax=Pseudarthrobacter siccitolerans TaxID=861266 RepID=A0A024H3Q7_9MICC|nr:polyphenol oxidase family protein [Pseudarthrobacter siccitolerans]CCQ46648.1 multi-copper polyphenol oxidoreductase laccase family protein [Pseudarthrobacter siccitolerans]